MFQSVMKTSCQIIESCWTKERAPVDTYIMGLATSIRERNDYEEQVGLISDDCGRPIMRICRDDYACVCSLDLECLLDLLCYWFLGCFESDLGIA